MAHRKLQQEVDKVFKKISEGLESFEVYYERHELSNNQTQRDKLENDMKKEIKKLQRLREQIKVWQSTNDVKDKDKLLKFRKLVETEMEKYKQVEKSSKQKAYSKEVLNQPEKLSPEDEFRLSTISYIQSVLEKLQIMQESIEADISRLTGLSSGFSSSSKKRKGLSLKDQEKKQELTDSIERIEFHQKHLELILRQLENNDLNLTTDQVNTLKDDLEYFLEMNLEPDFMFDDSIYEYLNLDAYVEAENADNGATTPISSSSISNTSPSVSSSKQNISSKENVTPTNKSPKKSLTNELHSNKSQKGLENGKIKKEIDEKPRVRESIEKVKEQEGNTENLKSHEQNEKSSQLENANIQISERAPYDNFKSQLSEKQQQKSWASFTADLHNHKSSPPNSAPASGIEKKNLQQESTDHGYSADTNISSSGTMVDKQNEFYKYDKVSNIGESAPNTAVSQSSFSNSAINNQDVLFSLKDKFDFSKIGYLARIDKPLNSFSVSNTKDHHENTHLSEPECRLLQDSSMVSLPSGIQMFIDSFVSSNCTPKEAFAYRNANDMLSDSRSLSIISSSSSIPIHAPEFQKLSGLWDTVRFATHEELKFLRLDPVTLFFGFYFGLSQAEKRFAMSLLYSKNWRLKNDQMSWYLKIDSKNSGTNESLGSSNFEVFNAFSWTASIVYNYNLNLETIVKI